MSTTDNGLDKIRAGWQARGIDNFVSERAGVIILSRISVAKEQRGQGMGTAAVRELVRYADETRQVIALSPSTDFGATSVSRLKRFYKQFGFVENRGRSKDFRISESMIRRPVAVVEMPPLPEMPAKSLPRTKTV